MLIQATNPNFSVGAKRGYCLMYVDDAGGVQAKIPPRTGTAKAAYQNEKNAARLRSGDSPVGLWVIGFLDFTAGPYTKEGHVFFMKHLGGGKYEIRDSEVGSGSRKPYGSIAELLGWFGAYKPKFIDWSTDCDGRQYVKVKEEDMAIFDEGARVDMNGILFGADKGFFKEFVGQEFRQAWYNIKDSDSFRRNHYVNKGDLGNYMGHIPSVEECDEFQLQLGEGHDLAKRGGGVTHKDAVYNLIATKRFAASINNSSESAKPNPSNDAELNALALNAKKSGEAFITSLDEVLKQFKD